MGGPGSGRRKSGSKKIVASNKYSTNKGASITHSALGFTLTKKASKQAARFQRSIKGRPY